MTWQTKKLGEVCKISTGKSNANEAVDNGEYAFFDRSKKIKRSKRFLFDCEALIIPGEGAEFFPRYYSGKFDLHQRAYALFGFDKNTDIRFVEYYLIFNHKYFERVAVGATAKSLRLRHFQDLKISVPSLVEQGRIVGILDKVFGEVKKAKENAEKNLQNAKELFENYLQGVFVNPEKNWKEVKLGEVCYLITKGSSPKWQGIKYVEGPGILFITSENVGEGQLILKNRKYVEEKFNKKDKKSILQKWDVLTNIVGASIGRTTIYTLDDLANINQAVCILRCKSEVIFNVYLMNLLNSPFLKIILHSNEVNTARANLSLGFFSNLSIPLPTMAEQKAIVVKLDALVGEVRKLEGIYRQKLMDLEELKKSVLKKAFSGDL
ncbi:MAG: restriction endonuclease subunit S [Patescibacteria group bacterium]